MIVSYAQHNEDLILSAFLKGRKNGFYVDVGANDPTNDSVTKLFYLKGWKGVNIEPLPSLYKKLTKERPRDTTLNVAIASKKGTAQIREYGMGRHGLSTLSQQSREVAPDYISFKDYGVHTDTLASVLKKAKVTHIDFMKIDVEGLEAEVIESNDWKQFRPEIIVVEDNSGSWEKKLKKEGYKEIFFDGLNRYFSEKSYPDFAKNYRDILAEEHVTNQTFLLQKETKSLAEKLQKMYETYNELADSWHKMHQAPENYISGKVLARGTVKSVVTKLRKFLFGS